MDMGIAFKSIDLKRKAIADTFRLEAVLGKTRRTEF
jgi:hypothetical protein